MHWFFFCFMYFQKVFDHAKHIWFSAKIFKLLKKHLLLTYLVLTDHASNPETVWECFPLVDNEYSTKAKQLKLNWIKKSLKTSRTRLTVDKKYMNRSNYFRMKSIIEQRIAGATRCKQDSTARQALKTFNYNALVNCRNYCFKVTIFGMPETWYSCYWWWWSRKQSTVCLLLISTNFSFPRPSVEWTNVCNMMHPSSKMVDYSASKDLFMLLYSPTVPETTAKKK